MAPHDLHIGLQSLSECMFKGVAHFTRSWIGPNNDTLVNSAAGLSIISSVLFTHSFVIGEVSVLASCTAPGALPKAHTLS